MIRDILFPLTLIVVTLVSPFVSFAVSAAADSNVLSELPLEVRQSVIKWNHKFKPYTAKDFSAEVLELFQSDQKKVAPMKVVADFNGDKIDDYALLGEAGKQQYLIAVLSNNAEPKVIVVEKWSDPDFKKSAVEGTRSSSVGVAYYLARAAGPLPESYAKKNNREAIQLEAYLGSVQLFKIENGKSSELKP